MSRLKIVILIAIVLLMSITIFLASVSAGRLASNRKRLADIGQIQTALNLYHKENGSYPYGNLIPTGMAPYLEYWPTPPTPNGVCTQTAKSYIYTQKFSGDDYSVTFCLGVKTEGLAAGMHVLSSKGIQ